MSAIDYDRDQILLLKRQAELRGKMKETIFYHSNWSWSKLFLNLGDAESVNVEELFEQSKSQIMAMEQWRVLIGDKILFLKLVLRM